MFFTGFVTDFAIVNYVRCLVHANAIFYAALRCYSVMVLFIGGFALSLSVTDVMILAAVLSVFGSVISYFFVVVMFSELPVLFFKAFLFVLFWFPSLLTTYDSIYIYVCVCIPVGIVFCLSILNLHLDICIPALPCCSVRNSSTFAAAKVEQLLHLHHAIVFFRVYPGHYCYCCCEWC